MTDTPSFKQQEEKLLLEMENSRNQIEILEEQLIQIREDKYFYKRKEDQPAFERVLDEEIIANEKIAYHENNILLLQKQLEKLQIQEKDTIKKINEMDKVLSHIKMGENRVQASKSSGIPFSKINRWYEDGKAGNGEEEINFYRRFTFYENYYYDFYGIVKTEFKKQNKIHMLSDFIPESYPQRLDRLYNEDSKIWFARLEINSHRSIYYFGTKWDNFPRLMLVFDINSDESNFRLVDDEIFILVEIADADNVKDEFRLVPADGDNRYYVSLGRLDCGNIFGKIEPIITRYIRYFSNPLKIF